MLKISELERKWDGVEKVNKLRLLKGVPHLGDDIVVLGKFTEAENPPRRQIISGRQDVAYFMGGDSGLGFGSVMWGQSKNFSESGEFPPLYQGSLSKIWGGENLTTQERNEWPEENFRMWN